MKCSKNWLAIIPLIFSLGNAHSSETYAELCAMTVFQPKDAPKGGPGGHAVMYLPDACKDYSKGFPQVKICDELDNNKGVGISTAKYFKNVSWVAVPTKDFFFNGTLGQDGHVNENAMMGAVERALELKIYDGVEFADEGLPEDWKGRTRAEQVAYESIGTDIALRYVRNSYCAKLPLTQSMLSKMVKNLNEVNQSYHQDENKIFNWNVFDNNCAHTLFNNLASVGAWNQIRTQAPLLKKPFNLALPSHFFIDVMQRGNDRDILSFEDLLRNRKERELFLSENWLFTQNGVLAQQYPVFESNDLFEDVDNFLKLEVPLIKVRSRRLNRYISREDYLDNETNEQSFLVKYQRAYSQLGQFDLYENAISESELNNEQAFELYERYKQYLKEKLVETSQSLNF